MQNYDKLYIDGTWVASSGTDSIDVINASTEEVMGRIPAGTAEDVDRAAKAAKAAFETWSQTDPQERAKFLQAMSDGIGARNQELAETICGEVGMPMFLSQLVQAGLINRHLTGFECIDFRVIQVEAKHVIPNLAKTGSRH